MNRNLETIDYLYFLLNYAKDGKVPPYEVIREIDDHLIAKKKTDTSDGK